MKRLIAVALTIVIGSIHSVIISPSIIHAGTLLYDDFNGDIVSYCNWHIPTWVSPTDGTFVGRTQFRCTQNSPLPAASNGNAIITVETYNPTGFSFYGTDLISNQSFTLGQGIDIRVRAKMNPSPGGIVGGIFLYALKPDPTRHDEIDFELLTNLPTVVQTNIYSNEPLGIGDPQFVSYASGSIFDYHTYEIKWLPNEVSWFIDGNLVRTRTSNVPTGPMNFHLNMWVPDSGWFVAYNPDLQPTNSASSNQVFSMSVDSVNIQSITGASSVTMLWSGTGGYARILRFDTSGNLLGYTLFGPYSGWTPISYERNPSDGKARLLWTHASGYACIWNLDSSHNFVSHVMYGPYEGWTPVGYARGSDGMGLLLWKHTSGLASLWILDSSDNFFTSASYGPYPGWSAQSIHNNSDGTYRFAWEYFNGQACIWCMDSSGSLLNWRSFGPYDGWKAMSYGQGSDGTAYLTWNQTSTGLGCVWTLGAPDSCGCDSYLSSVTFGPYPGWSLMEFE